MSTWRSIYRRTAKVSTRKSLKTMIEVLSHPTDDCASACISLQTRKGSKYIIGQCGEGLQRHVNQYRVRMGKLRSIFLTGQTNWKNIGGLPGFLLTVTDQGAKQLRIQSAGNNLAWAANSWRNFMFHNMADLQIAPPEDVYRDEFVAIAPVALDYTSNIATTVPSTVPPQLKSSLHQQPDTKLDLRSSSYIVQILPSRGKFLPQKATALGVKPGKAFGKLTAGESITTENGTLVTPEMVMDEPKVPPRVLVVDIPTPEHLDSAINTNWDRKISENTEVDIRVVYHFLGKDVDPKSAKYQSWIESFGAECLHYITHPRYSPNGIVLQSAAGLSCKLREHMPHNFTRLHSNDSELTFDETENVKFGYGLTVTALEPAVKHDGSLSIKHGEMNWEKMEKNMGLSNWQKYELTESLEEPEVITLGTGSALPSKYRNVLSSLVRVPGVNGWVSVLLDSGEGTLGQMKRQYGPDELVRRFQELKMIYISHLHADHHLGAVSVIREWMNNNNGPDDILFVVGPKHYELFLREWSQLEDEIDFSRIHYVDTETFIVGQGYSRDNGYRNNGNSSENDRNKSASPPPPDLVLSQELYQRASIQQIKACMAFHCEFSYSVSIAFATTKGGRFKVSFSGDSRPNDFFARRVGLNCDLLIHEATHDNDLADEARKKRHSTIGEAMGISSEMRAKATMLTHFSQRYPKLPELGGGSGDENYGSTALAFDGMRMYVSKIGDQSKVFDKLKEVFAQVDAEDAVESSNQPLDMQNECK